MILYWLLRSIYKCAVVISESAGFPRHPGHRPAFFHWADVFVDWTWFIVYVLSPKVIIHTWSELLVPLVNIS